MPAEAPTLTQDLPSPTESATVNIFLLQCEELISTCDEEEKGDQIEAIFGEWWDHKQVWGYEDDARGEKKAYAEALKVLRQHLDPSIRIVTENKFGVSRILGLPGISSLAVFIERKRQEREARLNAEAEMDESDVEELVFSHGTEVTSDPEEVTED